jgi:hypothetical protein
MIRFSCPECDAILEVSDALAGSRTSCATCGEQILVPIDLPCEGPDAPLDGNTVPISELQGWQKQPGQES